MGEAGPTVVPPSWLIPRPITDREFANFRDWVHRVAGISLSPAKKALVSSRLMKRLRHHGLSSYQDYFELVISGREAAESQTALNLLTTNETSFFREPQHFDFLQRMILPAHPSDRPFRVWSAACSSGEEPYTLAMVLDRGLKSVPWEIVASDISSSVLSKARSGHYPLERAGQIPDSCLKAYCLKGIGPQEGTFLIDLKLRSRIQFMSINLNAVLPSIGTFDVIFLRNVLFYFNAETKRQVVARLLALLNPGGYFFISHSETLHGVTTALTMVQMSVYRKD